VLDFSFWSILALGPSLLLAAGAGALVTWAVKLPDAQSELVGRLTSSETQRTNAEASLNVCVGPISDIGAVKQTCSVNAQIFRV
jgi:hypothetical protein